MLFGSIVAIGLVAGLVAIAVENPPPPPWAGLGERVYYRYCVDCHGRDGRGSWRALLFVIRPGDLTDAARMRADSDDYLRLLIKHGGAPLGRPGMPAFELTLDDRQIDAVIESPRATKDDPGRPEVLDQPLDRRARAGDGVGGRIGAGRP